MSCPQADQDDKRNMERQELLEALQGKLGSMKRKEVRKWSREKSSIEVESFVWSVEPTLNSTTQEDFLRIKIRATDCHNERTQDGLPPLDEWNVSDLKKILIAFNERRVRLKLNPAPLSPRTPDANTYQKNVMDERRNDTTDNVEDEMLLDLSESARDESNTSIGGRQRTNKRLYRALRYQLMQTIRNSAKHLADFSETEFSTQSRPHHPYYYNWVFTSEYPAFPDLHGGVSRWNVAQIQECRSALELGKLWVESTDPVSEISMDQSPDVVSELHPTQSPTTDDSNSNSERGSQLAECVESAARDETALSNAAFGISITLSKDQHKAKLGNLFEAAVEEQVNSQVEAFKQKHLNLISKLQAQLLVAQNEAKKYRAESQKERSNFEALDQLHGDAQQFIFELENKEKEQEKRIKEAKLEGEAVGLRNENVALKTVHENDLAILRSTHQGELKNAREESYQKGLIAGSNLPQTSHGVPPPFESLSNVDRDVQSERPSSCSPDIIISELVTNGSEICSNPSFDEDDITHNPAEFSQQKEVDSLADVEPAAFHADHACQCNQCDSEPGSDSVEFELVDLNAEPDVREPNPVARHLYEEALPRWLEVNLTAQGPRVDAFQRLSLTPSEENQVLEGLRQRAQDSGAFENSYKDKHQMRQLKLRIAGWTSELATLFYLPAARDAQSVISIFTAMYQKFMFHYWNWNENEKRSYQQKLPTPNEIVRSRSTDPMLHRRGGSEEMRSRSSVFSDLSDRQFARGRRCESGLKTNVDGAENIEPDNNVPKVEVEEDEEEDLYNASPVPRSAGNSATGKSLRFRTASPIVKGHKRQAPVLTQHPQITKLLNKKRYKKGEVEALPRSETEDDEIVYSSKRRSMSQSIGGRKRRRR